MECLRGIAINHQSYFWRHLCYSKKAHWWYIQPVLQKSNMASTSRRNHGSTLPVIVLILTRTSSENIKPKNKLTVKAGKTM